MREIKFRIFDKSIPSLSEAIEEKEPSGMMLYDFDYLINSDYFKCALNGEYPLMQYTGLTDKNGKEIYENDIIKCDDIVTLITWQDGGFQMITSENQGKSPAIQDRLKRFEVIGNIHENSSLLT